ncbi:SDR family oxidoreductase [Chitinophaga sp. CF418]|uniref:SDR family oxidoreductase n=1 Tax=Chitinophaga sp. CF418 TaxID=1855287 RepID=UPI000917BCBF|nr:SDR family oxidoreductase [Chitinophaga sp. CF418]SHN20024.1 NADP-dependent 3-hydroxy acid dehydrogenase YdfG [Chitinophaga sp. CF418]
MSNTIFITGASSGLGKATAKLFHSKGWNVIATMRKPEEEKELSLLDNVTLLKLDVTNLASIEECVHRATSQFNIDVVFNNAGYGLVGPLETLSDEQITNLLNTDLLGVIRVTKAFIPYFREKRAGLFINTSSIGGMITFPLNALYHAAKWGLEGLAESMHFELSKFGIGIKNILPGGIRTDFVGRSLVYGTLNTEPYQTILEKANEIFGQVMNPEQLTPPAVIAETVYEAATDGKNQLRYIAGEDGKQFYATRTRIGADAFREQFDQLFFGKE